jgi:hypothetical protein
MPPSWTPSSSPDSSSWAGPLEDERRVALAVETGSADDVRSTLAADPWSGTHLSDPTVEVWTIRLDGRKMPERTR